MQKQIRAELFSTNLRQKTNLRTKAEMYAQKDKFTHKIILHWRTKLFLKTNFSKKVELNKVQQQSTDNRN